MARESGQFKGRRLITGDRTSVRCVLYMATMIDLQYNPPIKVFYHNLKTKGKPTKVAITASIKK
ncbi:hypothetical protein ID47_05170 [Candidatus Paracaedibacter acanthamoebae]|uniref:Transposase n=2 Tax=Candidatus Odyssella acanthamoebae TaxID=91604 RepID=A0A077AV24_9PROT|nr:hypothetical protein ID47_05170 [Candidatus Paracaedibacter acanthamoebae]